ncbi:HAMP domain-containing sensor histidine kinase [Actinophytocola sp.]|uniref:HAMP domain-containing sensor histidine kinase n=1 Tax=Actinophytocola sp. TaxID=1872138 RepID=UPI002EDA0288
MGMRHGPVGWWQRRSLRARLTLAATLIFGISVTALSVLILFGVQGSLQASVDDVARQRAHDVAILAEGGKVTGPIPNTGEDISAVQILDAAGNVLASGADLVGNEPMMTNPLPAVLLTGGAVTRSDLPIGDGTAYRVVTAPTTMGGRPATIVVAASLAQQERTMAALRTGLALGMSTLVGVLALTTWVLTARTLRPVDRLRGEVDDISATDLHRRLALPPSADEVHRLATTLNRMLSRLEAASNAQRRFVGDAAHELRSPLTAITAQVDNAIRHPETAPWTEVGPVLMSGLRRLESLMDDLLALARLDDPDQSFRTQRDVDLDDLVHAEIARARQATTRTIDAAGVGPARVRADPRELTRVVRNLLDNAVRHAGHRVAVHLGDAYGVVDFVVADDGPGVPADQRDQVFDRFTRLDEARVRDSGGTGLGLAIVRELTHANGGRAWIHDPPPDRASTYPGAWVHVQLPSAAPPSDRS